MIIEIIGLSIAILYGGTLIYALRHSDRPFWDGYLQGISLGLAPKRKK